METIKVNELCLGDVVDTMEGNPYSCATVCQVTENEVEFFRPYTHHADFSYTGGVICYVGINQFKVPRNDNPITLIERCTIKLK